MRFKWPILLISALILFSCQQEDLPETESIQFDNFVTEILGYHLEGQEDTWLKQNEEILNLYEDALIFKDNDSLDVAYIGFAYGTKDLTHFKITKPNHAGWTFDGSNVHIKLKDGSELKWRIKAASNNIITIEQVSSKAILSMKIMD